MDRIFLDANVLFSAAYRADSGLRQLWELREETLITSTYALEEARRNLRDSERRSRLDELIDDVQVVTGVSDEPLPEGVDLPEKDRPILLSAIHAQATHLLTGDVKHFGSYYDHTVKDVAILPPAEYLREASE